MNKKGIGIGLIAGVLIALLLFAVVVAVYLLFSGNTQNILDAFSSQYTKPNIAPNDYFTAEFIGFASNGQPLQAGQLPAGCSANGNNKYTCTITKPVEFYVGIKNTGQTTKPFYAYPRVGYNCEGATDKCSTADDTWVDGNTACDVVYGSNIVNCPTNNPYTFPKKGSYRIFAAAKCLKADCFDPTQPSPNDVVAYNPVNYIDITVN